jgi:hypothetical protein
LFFCTLVTKALPPSEPVDLDGKIKKARRTDLVIAVLFLLMIGWLFTMADSQTPLIALFVAAALVAGLVLPFVRRHFGGLALTGIVIGVLLQLLVNVSGLIIESAGRDATLTGRTEIWATVLALNSDPLLGAGFQSFWLGDRLYKMWELFPVFRPNQAHNGYIETYLNLGWVGLFLFICVLVAGYRTMRQRLLDADGMAGQMRTENLVIAKFGIGFLFAFILYNVTEAVFVPLGIPFIAFLLMTIRCPVREPSLDIAPSLTPEPAFGSRVRISGAQSRSEPHPRNPPLPAPQSLSSPRPRWGTTARGTGPGAYRSSFKSNRMNRAKFSR